MTQGAKKVVTASRTRKAQVEQARSDRVVSKDRKILFGGKGKKKLSNHDVVCQEAQKQGNAIGKGAETTERASQSVDRRVALKLGALSDREATTPHQHSGDAAATAGTPAASLAGEASTGRLMVGTLSNGRLTAGSVHEKGGKTGKSDPGATPGPPIGTEVGLALGVSAQKAVMIPNRVATGSMPGGGSNEHREGEASVGAGNLGGLAAGTNIQELLDATSGGIRAHGGHQEPNCAITKEAGANPLNRDSDPPGHQVGGSVRSAPGTANDMGRKSIDEALQASQALKARRR